MSRVVRSFFAFIAATLFGGLLLVSALGVALRLTVVEPQTVKSWLSDSGVYEAVVEEVAKNMTIQEANENSVIQINSSEIVNAAQQAFPSSSLQREGETVIDGFYGWFKGDTSGPEFRVDFSQEKAEFAGIMAATLEAKVNELPECTSTGRFSVQSFDPFKADCRPKGVDLTDEITNFGKNIYESDDFLSETLITGGDLRVDANGQKERVGTAYPWVQRVYSTLLWAPWAILGLTVLSALGIIFLSSTRRKGIRRSASSFLLVGAGLLISGLFLGPALRTTVLTSMTADDSQRSMSERIVSPLLEQIIDNTYARYSIYFGAAYLAISLFMYGGLFLTRGKKEKHKTEPVVEENPAPEASAPTSVHEQPVRHTQTQPAPAERLIYEQPRPEPTPAPPVSVRPAPMPQPNAPMHAPAPHNRPHRQVTRRPPMIQG